MMGPVPVHRLGWDETAVPSPRGAVVAIGKFDGLHRGHVGLIDRARRMGARLSCPTVLCTFDPHPSLFFSRSVDFFRLLDDEGRAGILARHGVDALVVLPFDERMAAMSADAFVRQVLVGRLAVRGVVVGYNFFYGKGRSGSAATLKREGEAAGFEVDVVDRITADALGKLSGVSSTGIRGALIVGEVRRAALMLGYEYAVSGVVEALGTKEGPKDGTARMALSPSCRLAHGFYAVRLRAEGWSAGGVAHVAHYGAAGSGLSTVYLQALDGSLQAAGRTAQVCFVEWLRGEPSLPASDERSGITPEDLANASALLSRSPSAT